MNQYNPRYTAQQGQLQVSIARARFRFFRNIVLIGVLSILGLICALRSMVEVEAGTRYVVKSFGRTTGEVLEPGLHVIAPWQSGTQLSVQLMEVKETMDTPTSSGLPVSLESSLWVGLDPSAQSLVKFVNDIGAGGFESFVTSAKRSATRNVIAGYTYEDLYSSNRVAANDKIFTEVKAILSPKGIIVDRVLLRGVSPPQTTREALEKKAAAQQASEAMMYTISKEQQEIARKEMEAQGISKANKEISASLTSEYLQWYYIKALEGLAHSTNTTFVILPVDQKLTPMLNINHK